MGATFSRVKNWTAEVLSSSDLNAEIDNILNNLGPSGVDDYSTNAAQMRTQTDPGESGTESLATSLAGELERIRFVLKEMKGSNVSYWYESANTSLFDLNNAVGGGLSPNRIVSGRVRTNSQFPIYLVPNGAAQTVKADGTPTTLSYYIGGVAYAITADVTLTGLTAAPSSNATCSINDSKAADQDWTKFTGENGTEIPVDNMQSEISALVGKWAGFSLNNGSATEYFLGYVSSTTSITKCRRGYFFDSTDAPVPRVVYSDNDEIRLMKLTWVFATTSNTLTATYNTPTWGKDEPSSPSVGDFWYDTDNNVWKIYSVGSWGTASATLIGSCLQTTAACVGARSLEVAGNYSDLNTFELFTESATQVKTRNPRSQANVWGTTIKNDQNLYTWDITADLDSGITESANTTYYFYLTEEGDKLISDIRPYDRTEDLGGWYHPFQSWRCIGQARNDGSSNLGEVDSFFMRSPALQLPVTRTAVQSVEVCDRILRVDSSGGAFAQLLPPAGQWRGGAIKLWKTSSDFANITAFHNGTAVTNVSTLNEILTLLSDGTVISVFERRIPNLWTITTASTNFASTVAICTVAWTRLGDSLRQRYHVLFLQGTSFTAIDVSLVGGMTMDTTKILITTAFRFPVGPIGNFHDPDGGTTNYLMMPVYKTSTVIGHRYARSPDGATVLTDQVGSSVPEAATANTTVTGEFTVPVSGWGS